MKRHRNSLVSILISMVLILILSGYPTSTVQASQQSVPIVTIQAESCTLTGCSVGNYGSGFCGTGYVEYINQLGDGIEFNVSCFSAYSDYITLVIAYSQGHSTDQTLSLFVDSKFVQKINFEPTGSWDITWDTVNVPIYAAGSGSVELKYMDGDGDVDIDQIVYYPFMNETKLVIVPHEDDEILGFCGSIYNMINDGNDVKVVLMTNGDWNILNGSHTNMGRTRIRETVDALVSLGVPKENVIVLGYSDGILFDLYYGNNFTPPNKQSQTYGDDVLYGIYDYHMMQTGSHATYTRSNLLSDLVNVLAANHPTEIYTTSSYDTHSDHSSTYLFVSEAISISNISPLFSNLTPLLHETIIHGDESDWPPQYTNYSPTPPTPTPFTNPFTRINPPLNFNNATKIQMTSDMLSAKYNAIGMFNSQNNILGFSAFNYAFYRSDEFYWTYNYATMSYI